jgi:hypothetical protein
LPVSPGSTPNYHSLNSFRNLSEIFQDIQVAPAVLLPWQRKAEIEKASGSLKVSRISLIRLQAERVNINASRPVKATLAKAEAISI